MNVKEEWESFSEPHPCDSISGSSSSLALWLWGCCGQDLFQGGCRGQEALFGSVMTTSRLSGFVFYYGFAFPVNFLLCGWISCGVSGRWSPALGQDPLALCSLAALTLARVCDPHQCSLGIKATCAPPAPSDQVPETEPRASICK